MPEQFIPALIKQPRFDLLSPRPDLLQKSTRLAESASSASKRDELKKAAQEFESLFVSYLLKVMRETIEESGLTDGGLGKGIYTDLFDQELSRCIGRHGALGISELLLKSLPAGRAAIDSGPTDSPSLSGAERGTTSGIRLGQNSRESANVSGDSDEEIPDFRMPVQAPVSSLFGPRKDPFTQEIRFHKGLDLAAPEGTPIRAALAGEVVFAGYENGYGHTVVVQHANGVQTRYAHLGTAHVRRGEGIAQDHILGVVGNSGHSTGPHLHFEVTRWGEKVDPSLRLAD